MCINKAQLFAFLEKEIGLYSLLGLELYKLEDPEMIPALFLYDFGWGFQRVIEHYQRDVYYAAKQIVHNPALADEVAQEAWLKAHRFFNAHVSHIRHKLSEARGMVSRTLIWVEWETFDFEAWLEKVAHNAACDIWKKERRQQCLSIDEELSQKDGDRFDRPDIQLIREESLNEIRDLVDTLPDKYARVIKLRFFGTGKEDLMRFEEIAQWLELPVGTVRVQARRALTLFRRAFEAKQARLHELELRVG